MVSRASRAWSQHGNCCKTSRANMHNPAGQGPGSDSRLVRVCNKARRECALLKPEGAFTTGAVPWRATTQRAARASPGDREMDSGFAEAFWTNWAQDCAGQELSASRKGRLRLDRSSKKETPTRKSWINWDFGRSSVGSVTERYSGSGACVVKSVCETCVLFSGV